MNDTFAACLMIVAMVSMVTAAADWSMNGLKYAEWAPYGFALAVICLISVEVLT